MPGALNRWPRPHHLVGANLPNLQFHIVLTNGTILTHAMIGQLQAILTIFKIIGKMLKIIKESFNTMLMKLKDLLMMHMNMQIVK